MSLKPYDLKFEERDGYLYAYVAGEHDNFEISFAYWSEIAEKLVEVEQKKALVVEDIAEQSAMVDVYRLVTRLAELGKIGITVAFVDRYSSHQELNDFGILIGTNRGITCKAFHDESEAETWLLAQ